MKITDPRQIESIRTQILWAAELGLIEDVDILEDNGGMLIGFKLKSDLLHFKADVALHRKVRF